MRRWAFPEGRLGSCEGVEPMWLDTLEGLMGGGLVRLADPKNS
jgi:hypothetical protein